MATTPTAVTTMITSNPKLDESNWFTWIKKMKMVFLAAGLDGIVSGSPPTEKTQKERWDTLNRQMLAYLYMAISDDYQYLVKDEMTASDGWMKLVEYFQWLTFGAQMVAWKEFYEISHDPLYPLSQYIHTIMTAKQKLESLNCSVSNTKLKDLLIMRLHLSYDPVCITILAQKKEPSLNDIKSILLSSSASDIKVEDMEDHVLAAV